MDINPENIQLAGTTVRKAIEDVQGPMPPVFVVEFLLTEWRRYLALIHQEEGTAGDRWRQAVAAMDRLLWSVALKNQPRERTELLKALAGLVAALKLGMDAVHTDAGEREAFLSALRSVHLAILQPPAGSVPARPESGAKPGGDPQAADLSDTITLDVHDPRYRDLMELLSTDNVEQIDIKS